MSVRLALLGTGIAVHSACAVAVPVKMGGPVA